MKLTELEPRFVRYETRPDGQYLVHVPLAAAQGIEFLCPVCFARNRGPVGTHLIEVTFADRGARPEQGSHGRDGQPTRWVVSGTGVADLTLTPSIDTTPGCTWHGFVTNGQVTNA
jgi:Family of unknown function (DUF6527)